MTDRRFFSVTGAALLMLLAAAMAANAQTAPAANPGWRIGSAASAPSWLQIRAAQRTRYEYLEDQFRAGLPGEDMGIAMRTQIAEARFKPLFFGAEMEDARWYLDDENTPLVRDPSGESGDFVGNQIEGRVRWQVLPGNLTLEVGFAHVFLGEFAETAPSANKTGDPTYFYTEFEIQI